MTQVTTPLRPRVALAFKLLKEVRMTFNTLVERVEKDFAEMPGLEVTMAQGVRLWNIGADDCRFVIDALVDVGFLKWTTKRTVIRTGRTLRIGVSGES